MNRDGEKALDQMTRDEKVAAGYRPVRCSQCHGAGMVWNNQEKRGERCPQCHGEKFFWAPGPKPREPGE